MMRTGEAPVEPYEGGILLREPSAEMKANYARLRQESFEIREEASRLGQEPMLRAFSGGLGSSAYVLDPGAYQPPLPLLPESYDGGTKEVRLLTGNAPCDTSAPTCFL